MNKTLRNQIISTLSIVVVAGLGSLFVGLGMEWFSALVKPSQWIPNFVIPVVWSVIYILFVVALWMLLKQDKVDKTTTAFLVVNGVLNVLWCLLFFALNLTFLGLVVIILNLVFGWFLYCRLQKTENIFARLLLLYPVWLSVATTLNLAMWILN